MLKNFIGPISLFLVGLCLLLTRLENFPAEKVLWTGGWAIAGIYVFASKGFHKSSFIWGSMWFSFSILSVIRYKTDIKADVEIPVIIMIAALLWTINKTPLVPDVPPKVTYGKVPSSENNMPQ
jgi:hypothetical protein